MSELSRTLYRLRRESELSLPVVAKQIGLGKHLLDGFESGTCKPMKGTLKALANVYKADYRELWSLLEKVGKE